MHFILFTFTNYYLLCFTVNLALVQGWRYAFVRTSDTHHTSCSWWSTSADVLHTCKKKSSFVVFVCLCVFTLLLRWMETDLLAEPLIKACQFCFFCPRCGVRANFGTRADDEMCAERSTSATQMWQAWTGLQRTMLSETPVRKVETVNSFFNLYWNCAQLAAPTAQWGPEETSPFYIWPIIHRRNVLNSTNSLSFFTLWKRFRADFPSGTLE